MSSPDLFLLWQRARRRVAVVTDFERPGDLERSRRRNETKDGSEPEKPAGKERTAKAWSSTSLGPQWSESGV
jgi:hypothetical protein